MFASTPPTPSRARTARLASISLGTVMAIAVGACAKAPPMTGAGTGSGGNTKMASGGSGPTGSGGQTGTGGAPSLVMKDPSSYPHNSAGAKYPYPQGHASTNCRFPLYNTDTIRDAYVNWKAKFFQSGRVVRPTTDPGADTANPNDTVSEGIGYGMLIGVYMNDRPMFDALWAYAQSKFDGNGLMNWRIGQNGNVVSQGSATDADEDMAWALLMAGTQWGGSYNASAVTLINNIWNKEVEQGSNVLKPGDNFGGSSQTNPSYFAPSYYRAFASATNNTNWMKVVDSSYSTLTAASGQYGLVPNWTNAQGAGVNGPGNDTNGLNFGYDACRTPWRIALDYCENGEPRAKAYLDKINAFFLAQTLGGLKDGYTTSGTDPAGTLGNYGAGMSVIGPAGVAASASSNDAFAMQIYDVLAAATTAPARMNISGVFTYYHASLGVLSLLTVSGNFWHFAQ